MLGNASGEEMVSIVLRYVLKLGGFRGIFELIICIDGRQRWS